MAIITNQELLAICNDDPRFQAFTANNSALFGTRGYEAYTSVDNAAKGDFWNLWKTVYLQKIKDTEPHIPDTFNGLVEGFGNPNGGQARRLRINPLKPTSPRYRNLVANGSVDPFVIRGVNVTEEFYPQNFDFANNMTITDTDMQAMFNNPAGIDQVIGGIFREFNAGRDIQEYDTVVELINKIINDSATNVMQASQKIEVANITNASSNADMAGFIQVFKNLHTLMNCTVRSGKFNCKKYEHGMNPANYVLLMRADVYNVISTTLMTTAFHTQNLTIPFEVKVVKDFGGITYKDGTTAVLPCYSTANGNKGEVLGYNATGDPTQTMKQINELTAVDPNEKVSAVLIQKGAIWKAEQNPYIVDSIFDPAGRYVNYWASQPNKSFCYDASYDVIKFFHA